MAVMLSSSPNNLYLMSSVKYPTKRLLKVSTCTYVCNKTSLIRVSEVGRAYEAESELWAASCLRVRSFNHFKDDTFNIQIGLRVSEAGGACEEAELWATACLRVRSFNHFKDDTFNIQDHMKYLAEREFEALKERIAGKRTGFGRVSCINATIPLSHLENSSDDLCSACKFSENGEDRVVVGTLDINQCIRLPDEITGKRPQGIGGDFARAYLSNVCVAKELQRNGLGYMLVSKSKEVAEDWGISDLYVHVAIDNEPAKILYMKSGFVYENDEPAWQARFMDRPRRVLLWTEIPNDLDL